MGSNGRSRSKSRSPDRDRHRRRDDRDRKGDRDRSREKNRDRNRDRDRSRSRDKKERKVHKERNEPKDTRPESEKYGLKMMGKLKAEAEGDIKEEPVEKEGVNLGLSGALTADVNTFNGVVIKYAEPPEARVPKRRWRFYVFKGEEVLPTLHLHRQSAYLMGRDRKVCDLPIDHPSCSKQHAAFQYRLVSKKKDDGSDANRVLPYIIDLGSANGTYLNTERIEPKRYYELKEKDMLKFGFSSREYVLLHENSGE